MITAIVTYSLLRWILVPDRVAFTAVGLAAAADALLFTLALVWLLGPGW